ncbi:hypothetical protein UPYG_G00194380 [Umbra pygmaea]|uniref:Uncharacterized protein n=1 Tax=Umbra pygmaea TaxID=75934 RepID=A0ABD0WHN9_UMBPY
MNIKLVILIITLMTVEGKGDVRFWKDKVTLTCPGEGKFYKKYTTVSQNELPQGYFETTYDKHLTEELSLDPLCPKNQLHTQEVRSHMCHVRI